MSETPSVKVLEAIKPVNAGTGETTLAYRGLATAVERYKLSNSARSEKYWDSEQGSLEELSSAKQLASEYLLRTANKVVESHETNRDLWADRFTEATIELYGAPDSTEVAQLISDEYTSLSQLKDNESVSQEHVNFLLDTYRPLIDNKAETTTYNTEATKEQEAIHQYGKVILERYGPLFDLANLSDKTEFNATELHELFSSTLSWLSENNDNDWSDWEAIQVDGTDLSVDAANRKIKIASRRETATSQDARGLIAHELLVHALRAKNGYKTGDRKLATGLAGYLDAEEGLGILAEHAVTGELPGKAYDRYVDIGLALGIIDGTQKTRKEIFEISFARQLIRSQVNGTFDSINLPSLQRRVWSHVDRMYRGGPGDELGTRQAIFTKDIAYYVGYKKMAKYIAAQLANGRSASEVFDDLSQGKFDPTNPQHNDYLNR
jgi:hypothetical protein